MKPHNVDWDMGNEKGKGSLHRAMLSVDVRFKRIPFENVQVEMAGRGG